MRPLLGQLRQLALAKKTSLHPIPILHKPPLLLVLARLGRPLQPQELAQPLARPVFSSEHPLPLSVNTLDLQTALERRPPLLLTFTSTIAALVLAAGAAATPAPAATPPPSGPRAVVPMRDFFRNPEKTAFSISDDGQWVSYLAPHKSRLNIFVRSANKEAATRITDESARDIAGYFWKGSDTLVYIKDFGGDENFHLVSVTRDGKTQKDLTPFPKVRAEIVDDLREDPTSVLVGLNKRKAEVFDVYRVNVKTGELTLVAENPGNITGWHADHNGRIRLATTTDGVNTSLLYREGEKAPFKTVLTTNFRDSVAPQFFTPDNGKVYVASNLNRDKQAIVILDPATAKEEKVLFEHPEVDVDHLSYWHHKKALGCAYYSTWKLERKCFDEDTNALFSKLEQKLPGYLVTLSASNKTEDKLVVRSRNDRTRGAYWLYDRKADKLTKLAELSPWLDEKQMAEMKPITYKTRDGLTVQGYLTVPPGREARSLPVIVHPHGGPWARDEWGFNAENQFLANRGYAVLQMNFRGSTGYGRKFWASSFKEWGGKMQDDVSDALKSLVAQGMVDGKRACIYGGSYGGYATLAGLTYSPELYACGIDYVGVANLFTFMKSIPPYWKPYLEMMYEMVGHPEKDKALLEAKSPVFHADKIRAPLFVAQGKNDPRVNINESDQIVAALKKRGIDVPYMVKDNEGHGFRNEENRFDFYEAMEKFLAKHLQKPGS
jgi:dipeptidyl aminopeptidase/acylaminoacyl peptidase